MDCRLFYGTTRVSSFPVFPPANRRRPTSVRRPPPIFRCEFGGLNTPLEPTTAAGKLLTSVVLDGGDDFHGVATKELERLAAQRDEAVARLRMSLGSDEAVLHRRIAELQRQECRKEVEDVMYAFVFRKFSEMRVHLIPKLSKCAYNGRLEVFPSKDWELESIHSFEVLEMVREHLTSSIGLKSNSGVSDSWAAVEISGLHLSKLYVASILYGYFLKSASLRHQLEWSLSGQCQTFSDLKKTSRGCPKLPMSKLMSLVSESVGFGRISSSSTSQASSSSVAFDRNWENLRHYVLGFDSEMIEMCANPKSMEALSLIERHSFALFGDQKSDELVYTSFASLKRFLLEAVAFGSFLWETEDQVNRVYRLENNCC